MGEGFLVGPNQPYPEGVLPIFPGLTVRPPVAPLDHYLPPRPPPVPLCHRDASTVYGDLIRPSPIAQFETYTLSNGSPQYRSCIPYR